MLTLCTALLLAAAPLPPAAPEIGDTSIQVSTWKIDPGHSEVRFRIRHFVSRVSGTFTDWEGAITGDPTDWASGSVSALIRTASIYTANERRDNDLRSTNFFDAATYPEVKFQSRAVKVQGEAIAVEGDLTIRDVTRPVTLTGSYLGMSPGREGRDRVGFEVSTTINRLDYGVKWNRAVEGGGLMLGDDVTIEISIEAVKQLP